MEPRSIRTQGLTALFMLHVVMMLAFFFQIPPHPPIETPGFGMGPFLGAITTLIVLALMAGETRWGNVLAVLVAVLACVSFGPQKWINPATHLIWPMLVVAQGAVLATLFGVFKSVKPAD